MEALQESLIKSMRPKCVHCRSNLVQRPRGLCVRCYSDLDIRLATPCKLPYGNRGLRLDNDGPTPTDLPTPTTAIPGTPEKIAILRERAASRKLLFHPEDLTLEKIDVRGIYCIASRVNAVDAREES